MTKKGVTQFSETGAIPTLMEQALEVREHAYAPYSNFQVGAVLVTADGRRFCGCNMENASYSMSICAERSAISAAISAGVRDFHKIAIFGGKTRQQAETEACYPCGACLQVLAEFCPLSFPILLADGVHLLGQLLPSKFCL